MARDYHQEYLDRVDRALAHGFTSYGEERTFRSENSDVLNAGLVRTTLREMFSTQSLGPRELVDLYDILGDYLIGGETEITGSMRHELVAYYLEHGMDEAEAVNAMRDILGTS